MKIRVIVSLLAGFIAGCAHVAPEDVIVGNWVLSSSESEVTDAAEWQLKLTFREDGSLTALTTESGSNRVEHGSFRILRDEWWYLHFKDVLDNKEVPFELHSDMLILQWSDPPTIMKREK